MTGGFIQSDVQHESASLKVGDLIKFTLKEISGTDEYV